MSWNQEDLKREVPVPVWLAYAIIITYFGLIGTFSYYAEAYKAERDLNKRYEFLRKCYGRMSTDEEVQAAYEAYDIAHGKK